MLNSIVLAQLLKVESISPVRTAEEISGEFRHKEAERWREVECLTHSGVEVAEGDIFAVVWEDAMIGPGNCQNTGCSRRQAG